MGLRSLGASLADRARAYLREAERRDAARPAPAPTTPALTFRLLHVPAAEGGPAGALDECWSAMHGDLELLLIRRPVASGEPRWFWQAQEAETFAVFDVSGPSWPSREEAERDLGQWVAANL
jgi:hypothetical protein